MELKRAADVIQQTYERKLGNLLVQDISLAGAQAALLNDGTLVIPGTNELADWRSFNLDVTSGDSNRKWHAGFMRHARLLFGFAKMARPKLVLGHSLGAASAQIIACSLGVPAICLASPRPLRGRTKFRGEQRVINICRQDDAVCHVPFGFLNFRHLGAVHWIKSGEKQSSGSHRLKDYVRVMKPGRAVPEMPKNWP